MILIVGGQTGCDLGVLKAAKALHIKVTGYARPEFKVEHGPLRVLGTLGLIEFPDFDEEGRAEANAMLAQGLLILGNRSRGSNRIERAHQEAGHPVMWLKEYQGSNTPMQLKLWVQRNKLQRLGIAGNKESQSPGIATAVEMWLRETLPWIV